MVQPAACVYVPLPSCVQPFYNFTECSPPGSSVHGISQARTLERLPFPPPRSLHDPGVEPASPALAGRFFTTEPPGKSQPTEASLIFQSPGNMLPPYPSSHAAAPPPGTPALVPSAVGIVPKWLVAPFSVFLQPSSLIPASTAHPCVCRLPALVSVLTANE